MKNDMIPIRNLTITFLTILLVLFSVEITLFFKNTEPDNYLDIVTENENLIVLQAEKCLEDDFFTSATNVYNATTTYYTLDFTPELTPGYPLIDDLTEETQLDDALNIVVIGDSFVWGAYSTNRNELFWRLLENDLRQDGINVNVFGVGTTGANAYEELSWLTDYSLVEDLKPDLVIFGYVYNDSDDSTVIYEGTVNWDEELSVLSKIKGIFPNIYQKLIEIISAKTMYTSKYSNSNYINYDGSPPVLKGSFYEKYKKDFVEKLDEYASKVDFPVAVITLPPVPGNKMIEALYEPLEELYSSYENISYFDLSESFRQFASSKHNKNYSVNAADFHPGSATNKFYSDYIKEIIQKKYPQLTKNISDKKEKTNNIIINEFLPYRVSPIKTFEDERTVTYEIEYPNVYEAYDIHGIEISSYFLTNPLGKQHVKLAFSNPININAVNLNGNYSNIEMFYTRINPKLCYDDHNIFNLKLSSNNNYSVESDENITAILLSADFYKKETDRKIIITFEKA